MASNKTRMDAADSLFFERELESISSMAAEQQYAELMGLQLVPVEMIDPGSQLYTFRMFDMLGEAKRVASAGDDLPLVNAKGEEESYKVYRYGAAFDYDVDEIKAARLAGRSVDAMRALAAQRVLAQKLDEIIAVGDSGVGMKGLSNLASANSETASTKAATGTAWINNATADEIIKDFGLMMRKVIGDSKGVERPTRVLLPLEQLEWISTQPRSSTSDTTIKKFVEETMNIKVMGWEKLKTAGSGSVTRAIAYNPDITKVRCVVAHNFEMEAPEPRNFRVVVNCALKTAGVVSPYPKSVLYMDAI